MYIFHVKKIAFIPGRRSWPNVIRAQLHRSSTCTCRCTAPYAQAADADVAKRPINVIRSRHISFSTPPKVASKRPRKPVVFGVFWHFNSPGGSVDELRAEIIFLPLRPTVHLSTCRSLLEVIVGGCVPWISGTQERLDDAPALVTTAYLHSPTIKRSSEHLLFRAHYKHTESRKFLLEVYCILQLTYRVLRSFTALSSLVAHRDTPAPRAFKRRQHATEV